MWKIMPFVFEVGEEVFHFYANQHQKRFLKDYSGFFRKHSFLTSKRNEVWGVTEPPENIILANHRIWKCILSQSQDFQKNHVEISTGTRKSGKKPNFESN